MTEEAAADQNDGWDWARVEIFGHTKHYGRVREEDKLGVKMLRVDVPRITPDVETRWETFWYSAAAIFSLARTDEETVMKQNKPYESPYRLSHRPEEKSMDIEVEYEDGVPF